MPNESYVEITQPVYTAIESDQIFPNLATITITRMGNIDSFADVEVSVIGGSAQQGLDFDSPFGLPQNILFEPGQNTQTLEIDIFDDFDLEGTETIELRLQTFPLGNPDIVIGDQSTAIVEILDNEVSYIEFTEAVYRSSESDQLFPNSATVTLTRTGDIYDFADAEVWLNGGSAQQGLDFDSPLGLSQPVFFEPGQTTTTIEFEILDDFDIEGTETVELRLQTFPGNQEVTIGDQATTSLEIFDNELSYIEFV